MKQVLYFFVILIAMTSCNNFKTQKVTTPIQKKELTGNIQSDLTILLPNGEFDAEIMDGIYQSPRQIELTNKFQTAIQENREWFSEFIKTVPQGEPLPFNENLGLTKDEYLELMDFMENIELVSTGKEKVKIVTEDSLINFKSSNKLAGLNSLTIDMKNNVVNYGKYKLIYSDTINVVSDKSPIRSKWKGFKWKFEEPKDFKFENLTDFSGVNIKEYTFSIGRLEKNGKTYMRLKGREVENGVKTIDINLPIEF